VEAVPETNLKSLNLPRRQRGLLYELSSVIISSIIGVLIAGIIAILIGVVVGPMQEERELSNLDGNNSGKPGGIRTTLILRQLADSYVGEFGELPASVAEMAAACTGPSQWSDCSILNAVHPELAERLLDGKDGGFIYYWDAANGRMEGWPAAPGLTASKTVVTFDGQSYQLLDTPGADEARAAAFAELRKRAGDVVGAALSGDPDQPLALQAAVLNVAAGDINNDGICDIALAAAFDTNGDQLIDGFELTAPASYTGDQQSSSVDAGFSALGSVLAAAGDVFAYGAGDEDVASFGLGAAAFPGCSDATPKSVYFSYQNLEWLTRAYVEDDNVEGRLVRLLREASKQAKVGNVAKEQQALQAYVDGVEDKGVFQWITRNHQVALKVHAQVTASPGVTLQ